MFSICLVILSVVIVAEVRVVVIPAIQVAIRTIVVTIKVTDDGGYNSSNNSIGTNSRDKSNNGNSTADIDSKDYILL